MVNFNLVMVIVGITTTVAAEYKLQYVNEDSANQFEEFIKTYEKKYEHELEKALRFGIFVRNLEEIAYQNEKNEGFVYGINQFSDLTREEFIQYHTGFKADHDPYSNCIEITHSEDIEVESEFDWRQKGMVTRVKNQGRICGSCWAFSTIGNVESANAIKTGQLQELSEQQLVDCDTSSSGCSGGFPKGALWYLKEKGSMSESSYPYTANDGNCRYDPNAVAVKVQGCAVLKVNEDQLPVKLQKMGPLSIALDGNRVRPYNGGVLQGATCVGGQQDHAVLLVGYGIDSASNKPYWLVKNSWGENWGEQGYFRMERGVNCLNFMEGDNIVTAVL